VELVVIGGGPAGYPAAFDAADRGMDVALVNDEAIPGGVCLHRGCIPSKALLHVAQLLGEAHDATQWGITFAKPKIDLDKLRSFKESVVKKLTGGVGELCKARGVKLVQARARFLDSTTLELKKPDGSTQKLAFGKAIVATGSSPIIPPIFAIKDPRVMDSTAALDLPDVPERLLVVGGGYIGLEMGSVYAALGSQVTVVEMTAGLLPGADRDLVRPLKARLDKLFASILLNTKVVKLTATKEGIVAELEGEGAEPKQIFDRVLVSVGRRPNSRDLGLENTRAQVDEKGFIKVDPQHGRSEYSRDRRRGRRTDARPQSHPRGARGDRGASRGASRVRQPGDSGRGLHRSRSGLVRFDRDRSEKHQPRGAGGPLPVGCLGAGRHDFAHRGADETLD
jgi:dihydrolipoyl dehydrogenase